MPKIKNSTRKKVLIRANECCEYCKYLNFYNPSGLTIDHIYPTSLGGSDDISNLASCCISCNNSKFTSVASIDPVTKKIIPLYNPRNDNWNVHFKWVDNFSVIEGLTAKGRATILRLKMNNKGVVNFRKIALGSGHPPN